MTNKKIRWQPIHAKGWVLVFSLWAFFTLADDPSLGEINIELRGNIVNYSCVVAAESRNLSVELGSWPTRFLQGTAGGTPEVPFTLQLSGCPGEKTLQVYFAGQSADGAAHLLGLSNDSTATNVGVALLNQNKEPLPPNAFGSSNTAVTTDANGNATLHYYARYAVIAAASPIQAGSANASAALMIDYD
ncbi:hypothetical protein Z042_15620 [Chania multitudinisentens RB-25]|uniref:Fimbrial-type adhesion domain-containing protein n=1 Tax=Chania multitudinisentens RB-25 TaxID=1441930 RepID=W0LAZ4_9GAMM|nr:fimbrial protein [Chania multitudinisentens]AHG20871.1 hypothetical protein Z042_15620 [Chania multitudinisentens RB-25]